MTALEQGGGNRREHFEYDEERELELLRKEIREIGYEEGYEQGRREYSSAL